MTDDIEIIKQIGKHIGKELKKVPLESLLLENSWHPVEKTIISIPRINTGTLSN